MPLLVTTDEVNACTELAGRLSRAATIVAGLGNDVSRVLVTTSWSGVAAEAGRGEANRLGARLVTASSHLASLSIRTHQAVLGLTAELARRRHLENSVLHELGRLAAVPGDIEARSRAALSHQIHGHLPAIFRHVLP